MKTRKSLPLRLVHSLGYDCILGMDFLKIFGLTIDFGEKSGGLPGGETKFPFSPAIDTSMEVLGVCAGLADSTYEQKQRILELVTRIVRKPGQKLSTTNLTKHTIELSDYTPIKINSRRVSPAMLKEMHKLVDQYIEEDVIEPCKTPWSSPPVLAKKSNGK